MRAQDGYPTVSMRRSLHGGGYIFGYVAAGPTNRDTSHCAGCYCDVGLRLVRRSS